MTLKVLCGLVFLGICHAQYYLNAGGAAEVDPYYRRLAQAHIAAQRQLYAQAIDPAGYASKNGKPLSSYANPAHVAALYQSALSSPYYGQQYRSGYTSPAAAWYHNQYTAYLPHVAPFDIAPVVSDSGSASEEAARRLSAALSPEAMAIAAARARAAAAAAAGRVANEVDTQAPELHPLLTEVETTDIPRCFSCDRSVEDCRLECQTFDSVAATYSGYHFDSAKFVGEKWWQERSGLSSIPKVTPESAREFCTTRIGGSGSFHSVFMKSFHIEFCLLSRLVKRPDLLTKFQAVQYASFRKAIDTACNDPRYTAICLPADLADTACPATSCSQCQAIATSALNAATGGESFDLTAFTNVARKELASLKLPAASRSLDALAARARELYSVTTQLTGRSDRDKLVIVENLCASFGKPSCYCVLEQVNSDGAGKKVDSSTSTQGSLIVGEGENVAKSDVKNAIAAAAGSAASVTLEAEASKKAAKVDTLKQEEEALKAKIAREENAAKELDVAAKDSAKAEANPDATVDAVQEETPAASEDEDAKVESKVQKDKRKIKKAEKKLRKLEK